MKMFVLLAQISVIIVKRKILSLLALTLVLIFRKGAGEKKITMGLEGTFFKFSSQTIVVLRNFMINENTIRTFRYHCLNL